MKSLIVVEPPALWERGKGMRTMRAMRVARRVAVYAQALAVHAACENKNNRVLFSNYFFQRMAETVQREIGGELVRMKWFFSSRRQIEVMWQAVENAMTAPGLDTVVLIDPVANAAVLGRLLGVERKLNPGEIIQINGKEVTKLL